MDPTKNYVMPKSKSLFRITRENGNRTRGNEKNIKKDLNNEMNFWA